MYGVISFYRLKWQNAPLLYILRCILVLSPTPPTQLLIIVHVYAEDSNPGLNSTYLSSVLVVNINFHIQTITAHIRKEDCRQLFFIFNRLNRRKKSSLTYYIMYINKFVSLRQFLLLYEWILLRYNHPRKPTGYIIRSLHHNGLTYSTPILNALYTVIRYICYK